MTEIDLQHIGLSIPYRWEALKWIENNYGTVDQGNWEIVDLRYVKFKEDKHATLFILRWT